MPRHVIIGDTDSNRNITLWRCTGCSLTWEPDEEGREEAMGHQRLEDSPQARRDNCIANGRHMPQPLVVVYESTKYGNGDEYKSSVQADAHRSRVTHFHCPNCGDTYVVPESE